MAAGNKINPGEPHADRGPRVEDPFTTLNISTLDVALSERSVCAVFPAFSRSMHGGSHCCDFLCATLTRKCGYVIVQATSSALVRLCPFDVGVGRLVFKVFLPLR